MSELGKEPPKVQAIIKGNCLSFGHCFAPGTSAKRKSDGKIFSLAGVMSNWALDGEVTYLGVADDHEQAWIVEEALITEGTEWDLEHEVNANDIAERQGK